jgi:hypothetical protein
MIARSPTPDPDAPTLHLVAPPPLDPCAIRPPGRLVPAILARDTAALKDHDQLVTIGDRSAHRAALALGLDPDLHSPAPLARPALAKRMLLARTKPFERVVCWSDELAHLAASLRAPAELISTNPAVLPALPGASTTLRVLTGDDHDTWTQRRAAPRLDDTLIDRIIDPTPDPVARRALRTALDIDDDTIVLAATADAPSDVNAREFAFLLGLLAVSGFRTVGLIPRASANLHQAVRHHNALKKPFRLIQATRPLPELLPIIDACVIGGATRSASTVILQRLCESAGPRVLHLRHAGKAGFTRSQRIAARVLDQIDEVAAAMKARQPSSAEPLHA